MTGHPTPIFQRAKDLALQTIPATARRNSYHRRHSIKERVKGQATYHRAVFIRLRSNKEIRRRIGDRYQLSHANNDRYRRQRVPAPGTIRLPFFTSFLRHVLRNQRICPIAERRTMSANRNQVLMNVFYPRVKSTLMNNVSTINGKGKHRLQGCFLPFLHSFFQRTRPIHPFRHHTRTMTRVTWLRGQVSNLRQIHVLKGSGSEEARSVLFHLFIMRGMVYRVVNHIRRSIFPFLRYFKDEFLAMLRLNRMSQVKFIPSRVNVNTAEPFTIRISNTLQPAYAATAFTLNAFRDLQRGILVSIRVIVGAFRPIPRPMIRAVPPGRLRIRATRPTIIRRAKFLE